VINSLAPTPTSRRAQIARLFLGLPGWRTEAGHYYWVHDAAGRRHLCLRRESGAVYDPEAHTWVGAANGGGPGSPGSSGAGTGPGSADEYQWIGEGLDAIAKMIDTFAGTPKQQERTAKALAEQAKWQAMQGAQSFPTPAPSGGGAGWLSRRGLLGLPNWLLLTAVAGGGLLLWKRR